MFPKLDLAEFVFVALLALIGITAVVSGVALAVLITAAAMSISLLFG